ncbi:hypothetical protein Tco_0935868 [Tanacetum coccineum]
MKKREDLETLYKLVKSKYESTRPMKDLDLVLWNDLKTMFKPHVEDRVWRNQQDYKVLSWKLYDSCGVHFLRMQHVQIYMLVEKKYPLTPSILTMMLEKKLMIDYESEMAYQLLKFIGRIVRIKSLLDAVRITAAHVFINTAQLELVLLVKIYIVRRDLQLNDEEGTDFLPNRPSGPTNNVADEGVCEEMDDSLERAATTATSLDAEQDRGNINKTQSKATLNEPSSLGTSSGLGEEDASKQERIAAIDADARNNLVSTHFDADTDMFGVHDLVSDEVVIETEVASKDVNLTVDEVTLAQALAALKSAKPKADKVTLQELEQGTITTTTTATTVTAASTRPKAKGLIIHDQEQAPTPTVSLQQPSQLNVQDKGKGKMVEPEHVKKLSKKYQLMLDEELAFKLQAKEEEEERLAREKNCGKVVKLIEVVPGKEEVAIDAIPLATKPPSIVDYKIHKEGKKTYYQIIRADGSSKMYLVFSHMLKSFNREDLETLWKLVKAKHGSTRPEEGYERVL